MAGVNKVILIGNLGQDPEVRYLESGSVVARISLATSETYRDKMGNRQENTEWHDVEMWDGLAKIAEQYLKKGDTIYIEGKIRSDKWQDKEGNPRKTIRIRALSMNMLSRNSGNSPTEQNSSFAPKAQASEATPNYGSAPSVDNTPDDLPF